MNTSEQQSTHKKTPVLGYWKIRGVSLNNAFFVKLMVILLYLETARAAHPISAGVPWH
jgi:hypothetical protein